MNKKTVYGSIGLGLMVALTFSPVSSALAEEIDEIVVSATGIPTPLAQIGASVDVITAEDLERQQITYLQDALATVAGVSVYSSGGPRHEIKCFLARNWW
jgi:vitamin B12 transporter